MAPTGDETDPTHERWPARREGFSPSWRVPWSDSPDPPADRAVAARSDRIAGRGEAGDIVGPVPRRIRYVPVASRESPPIRSPVPHPSAPRSHTGGWRSYLSPGGVRHGNRQAPAAPDPRRASAPAVRGTPPSRPPARPGRPRGMGRDRHGADGGTGANQGMDPSGSGVGDENGLHSRSPPSQPESLSSGSRGPFSVLASSQPPVISSRLVASERRP